MKAPLRNILIDASNWGGRISWKYIDSEGFTIPVSISPKVINKVIRDFSIEKLRIEIPLDTDQ